MAEPAQGESGCDWLGVTTPEVFSQSHLYGEQYSRFALLSLVKFVLRARLSNNIKPEEGKLLQAFLNPSASLFHVSFCAPT